MVLITGGPEWRTVKANNVDINSRLKFHLIENDFSVESCKLEFKEAKLLKKEKQNDMCGCYGSLMGAEGLAMCYVHHTEATRF